MTEKTNPTGGYVVWRRRLGGLRGVRPTV